MISITSILFEFERQVADYTPIGRRYVDEERKPMPYAEHKPDPVMSKLTGVPASHADVPNQLPARDEVDDRTAGVGTIVKKGVRTAKKTFIKKNTTGDVPSGYMGDNKEHPVNLPVKGPTTAGEDLMSGLKKTGEAFGAGAKKVGETIGHGIKRVGEEVAEHPGTAAAVTAGTALAALGARKIFGKPKVA